MARNYSNTSVETTLASSIGASDTLLAVTDSTGMPVQFPFSLILDFEASSVEVVTVTDISGPNFVVTRGEDGTGAQSHEAGAVVVHGLTARDASEPQLHIDATSDVHGVGATADVVGTDTVQTLTNKTLTAAGNTLTVDLDDLADVSAPTPADGDILRFDSGGVQWVSASGAMPDRQVFEASGTWNKPAGARWVEVECQAGGGGSGNAATSSGTTTASAGHGGGAGGYVIEVFSADSLGASETVTIGQGGAQGNPGTDGGSSSFGTHLEVTGGGGGGRVASSGDAFGTDGGSGGFFTGVGSASVPGQSGDPGFVISGDKARGGKGGDSALGHGGAAMGSSAGSNTGNGGAGYGAGGGGAARVSTSTGSVTGGDGTDGVIFVTSYF